MRDGPLALVAEVARALGDLRGRIVFIGGAIAPLLQIDRAFAAPRPTSDVDAIVVTANYSDFEALRSELRSRGFREIQNTRHAHKWTTPGAGRIEFDVVPAGTHLGASGNPWDTVAVETAVETTLEEGLTIRHASAPGFLGLKFAAFHDRGLEDPFGSSDLEDVFALLASRATLPEECARSREDLRSHLADEARKLITRGDYEDLQAGHLSNVYRARTVEVIADVQERLRQIAEL